MGYLPGEVRPQVEPQIYSSCPFLNAPLRRPTSFLIAIMFYLVKSLSILTALLFTSFTMAQSPTTSSPLTAPTSGYCYYPGANPSSAQNDRPCDPDAETSMCCPTGWTCMSNKICQVTDGSLAQAAVGSIRRATCTDPRWNQDICGDFCLSEFAFCFRAWKGCVLTEL